MTKTMGNAHKSSTTVFLRSMVVVVMATIVNMCSRRFDFNNKAQSVVHKFSSLDQQATIQHLKTRNDDTSSMESSQRPHHHVPPTELREENFNALLSRSSNWEERLNHWNEEVRKNPTWIDSQNRTIIGKKPGAWIHVGKSGGTTLLKVTIGQQHNLTVESSSYMAKYVTRCHMDHCGRKVQNLRVKDFEFLIWLVRDPFERTGSAFEYMHPRNELSPTPNRKRYQKSFKCFPSYEQFAYLLDETSMDSLSPMEFPIKSEKDMEKEMKCRKKAKDIMSHQITEDGGHLHWDTGYWVDEVKKYTSKGVWKIGRYQNHNTSNDNNNGDDDSSTNSTTTTTTTDSKTKDEHLPYMLVIRNERLWEDYKVVNYLLGQKWNDIQTYEEQPKGNFHGDESLSISRNLTLKGRRRICNALQREYEDYFWVLKHASNLNSTDIQKALNIAHKNCPNINL